MRLGAILVGLSLALPSTASGFQLKRTDAGEVVRWETAQVRLLAAPSVDGLTGGASASRALLDGALAPWLAIDGSPLAMESGSTTQDAVGYDTEAPETNRSLVVAVDRLPEGVPDGLAVTFVTYRPETGEIVDADVVVRTHGVHYSTSGERGRYDLQSVLTHEIGHALGLEHEPAVLAATMFPEIGKGETAGRTLDADDEAGFLEIYGQAGADVAVRYGGCSTAPGAPGLAAIAGLLGMLALALRRPFVRRAVLSIFVAAALFAVPAVAEEGVPAHFVAASVRADLVVVGTVRRVESRWTGRWVETVAEIEVRRSVGQAPASLAVRTIGGEADGVGTWVAGAARFRPGEKVAVALARAESGVSPVSGADGVLALEDDAQEGDSVLQAVRWASGD